MLQKRPAAFGGDVTTEIARIEQIVRDGIAPRIPSFQVKSIPGFSLGPVIFIRIGKSRASPHMINANIRYLFYARNSTGKFHLDVAGIRSAFLASEFLGKRIEAIAMERIAKISMNETPVPLEQGPRVVMQLFPVSALDSRNILTPQQLEHLPGDTTPIAASGFSTRINLDGFVSYDHAGQDSISMSYTQFFRNGTIEAVTTKLLGNYENKKIIPYVLLESEMIRAINRSLSVYRSLLVSPPAELRVSLLGAKDYEMASRAWLGRRSTPIERENVFLPGILIENFAESGGKILRPVFDALWNACGYQSCPNYNEQGEWYERRS